MSETGRPLRVEMRTTFQDVLLVTFAVAPEALRARLPSPVRPRVIHGQSFVSIVIASMRAMRPGVLPEIAGVSAYQVVYRAVAELQGRGGEIRRGVFFLRSDCNDAMLSWLGNRLSHFRFHYFHPSAVSLFEREGEVLASVRTRDGVGDLLVHAAAGPDGLQSPCEGPFASAREEHDELVNLFDAFSVDEERVSVMSIERQAWVTERLRTRGWFSAFFRESGRALINGELVSVLRIRECAYVWHPVFELERARLEAID